MNLKGKSIALFDFSHAINVAFNAIGPNEAGAVVLQQLSAIRSATNHVVVCLDSKPYKRASVYPEYKAQRKQDPELANIWARTLQLVRDAGYQCAEVPNTEADDIMATLGREFYDAGCQDVRFVTADKDISQCVGAFRTWFVPQLGKRDEFEIRDTPWMLMKWGNTEWHAREKEPKQGPTPDQVPLLLAIMGDTSDHIPGVKGIGIVQAMALIKTYKTTDAITRAATDAISAAGVEGKKPSAIWENWIKGMIDVPKWLALTTLDDHVELPRPALSYLEYIAPKPLVEEMGFAGDDDAEYEAAERAAIGGETVDMGEIGGAPTAAELEEERLAMAASLPVDRREPAERRAAMSAEADKVFPLPPIHDPSKMVIGKDPKADDALRELAAKLPPNALAGKPSSSSTSTGPSVPPPPAPVAAAAPSAAGAPASTPSAATPPAPAQASPAQLVSKSQGPRKQDEIDEGAIVRVEPPSWALSAQPQTVKQMLQTAAILWNSQQYQQFGSDRGVFSVMALGRELGMGFAESLQAFHIVKDRPYPKAKWILSRCQKHPDFEYYLVAESTETYCVMRAKHRKISKELEFRYTIEEANLAGHTTGANRDNWRKSPRSMLRARAITGSASEWCPGAAYALPSAEEAEDYEPGER